MTEEAGAAALRLLMRERRVRRGVDFIIVVAVWCEYERWKRM